MDGCGTESGGGGTGMTESEGPDPSEIGINLLLLARAGRLRHSLVSAYIMSPTNRAMEFDLPLPAECWIR